MSRARPYASAVKMMSDSATLPAGTTMVHRGIDREICNVSFALYSGQSSHGYQTNYTHVSTWWLECHVYGPARGDGSPAPVVHRVGWRFTGKGAAERAESAYRKATSDLAKRYPGCDATFPTSAAA